MAHYLKFSISLVFALLGVWAFVALPLWQGVISFFVIGCFGSWLASRVFKRYATLDEIKEDLQARLDSD
ncbi:hypothetical protein [Anderseniella sp. Alg231-50]|uniref:hypothetical protein n=1 Tax=Anderseniella sp. Alg231-50 TaxID=1922226 RepID=UPI000D558D40